MPKVFDNETGELVDVDAAAAQQGFQAGRFGLTGDTVNLIDESGKVFNVDAGEVQEALQSGFSMASDEAVAADLRRQEFGSGLQRVAGDVEAVGRGLTFGALTPLEVAAGVDPEDIRARQESIPEATALEIAGSVAPVLLSGGTGALGLGARGTGALARAGQGARALGAIPRATAALGRAAETGAARGLAALTGAQGTSIAARAASAGLGAAVEGAAFGAGQILHESALGDIELTAENVLAGAARGAVFGGATVGLLSGVGSATGKAFKAAARKTLNLEAAVEGLADRATFRQFKPSKALAKVAKRKFGDDAAAVIAREVREEGIEPFGKSFEEILATVESKQKDWGARVGEAVRALDDVVDDTVKPSLKKVSARLRSEVITPLKKSSSRTARQLGKRVEAELSSFDPLPSSPRQAADTLSRARRAQKTAARRPARDPLLTGTTPERGAGQLLTGEAPGGGFVARRARPKGELGPLLTGKAPRKTGFSELHQMRRELDVVAYPPGRKADPTPFQAELQKARRIIEDEFEAAADVASKAADESIQTTYQQAKRKYAVLSYLRDVAQNNVEREFANRTISLTDTIAGVGVTGSMLSGMLAGDESASGSLIVAVLAGKAATLMNRFVRTQGQRVLAAAGNKLLTIGRSSGEFSQRVERAAAQFYAPVRRALPLAVTTGGLANVGERKQPREQRYLARVGQLQEAVDRPADMLGIEDEAPQVADAIKSTMLRAQTFLASKIPVAPQAPGVPFQAVLVPQSEQAKFLRYARATDDFSTFVDDVAQGAITPEGIEAAQAVYPRAFAQLRTSLETQLALQDVAKLSPAKRVQLSLILGRPVHFSMQPEFIATMQGAFANARDITDQQVTPSRRSTPDVARQEITRTDAMERA